MKTLFVAIRAILWASGFILLWGWLAMSARRYDARLEIELPPAARIPGVVLMIPGALLAFACIASFIVRGRGTPAPFDPPRVFVATGPYRYVRNPMYVGAAVFLLGLGLFERSPSILILSAISLAGAHLFVLVYEEPALEDRFGASYLAYKRDVRRWIPRRPRSSS
jgi:protein-S-isoprenylcysteine O-methyltransferase Ste14